MADTAGQSGALPPINYLDIEKIKRETAVYGHNAPVTSTVQMSAPPLVSPSSMYSGPPPPYSYPSSAASSVIGDGRAGPGIAPGNYMSPPETRRSSDEKEQSASQRQSLPSINEALNTGEQQPISISSLLSTNAPPHKITLVTKSPTSPVNRPFLDSLPKGPPEFFPQHTVSSNHRPQEQTDHSTRPIYSPGAVSSHGESRFPTINSLSTARSYDSFHTSKQPTTAPPPTDYSRPGASPIQNNPVSSPSTETHPRSVAATTAPFGYTTYQPAYAFPTPSTTGIPSYRRPTAHQPTWRGMGGDLDRPEEMRRATKESPPPRPAYGESVKRHLDIYDLETSLNDIAEVSGRALTFSRDYGTRAHQTQRSGPIPGSLPTLVECDQMIQLVQGKMLDSFARIRDVIYKQQQALVEQRNYDERNNYKPPISEADDDASYAMDKLEGSGGFAGSDPKKRRGRAAPPGRCHSCNRAETPEWRRGPDGARTLCNACGLHYAKLTRKMGSKAPNGPSNLRPKESSPSSP